MNLMNANGGDGEVLRNTSTVTFRSSLWSNNIIKDLIIGKDCVYLVWLRIWEYVTF